MQEKAPLYFLIKDDSILFSREYYKPAFVRFVTINNLVADFPDSIPDDQDVIDVGEDLVLVHESRLEDYTETEEETKTVVSDLESSLSDAIKNIKPKRIYKRKKK